MVIPDPGASELIVRATHVEAPPIDIYEDVDGQRSFALEHGELEEDAELTPEEPAEFADFVGLAGHGQGHDEQVVDYDAEADEPGDAGPGREVDAHELTPAGRYRASVTEDPEFVWHVPAAPDSWCDQRARRPSRTRAARRRP